MRPRSLDTPEFGVFQDLVLLKWPRTLMEDDLFRFQVLIGGLSSLGKILRTPIRPTMNISMLIVGPADVQPPAGTYQTLEHPNC